VLHNLPFKKLWVQTLCVAARSDYGKSAGRSNQKEKSFGLFLKNFRPFAKKHCIAGAALASSRHAATS